MFSEILDFQYESSSIDWCESNYYFSNFICEFNNSWSSLLYIFFSLYTIYYYSKFIKNCLIYYILFSSILVGITSYLFHSTLSIGGQILDEGSIILFIISSDITINKKYLVTLFFSIFLILSLSFPFYCRFILLSLGSYIIYNTVKNIKFRYVELWCYFRTTLYIFISAIVFWIIDIFFCDYLLFATHFIWHILTSIALHNLIILTIAMNNDRVNVKNKYILNLEEKEIPFNKLL